MSQVVLPADEISAGRLFNQSISNAIKLYHPRRGGRLRTSTQRGDLEKGLQVKNLPAGSFYVMNKSKEIIGILDIDYPGLSDKQIREIELGNPEEVKLPGGRTVAEYAALVAQIKEKNLAAESDAKEKALKEQNALETAAEVPPEKEPAKADTQK